MKTNKKRSRSSVFDAVDQLETIDARVARKRTTNVKDIAKTKAALSQTKLHGHLMECRILFQRIMTKPSSLEDCNQLLANLLTARSVMMYHSTISNEGTGTGSINYHYSEIVKDDKQLEQTIDQEYKNCKSEWEEVLNRRHKDLQLHSGLTAKAHFKIMDSTFWQQVEATVAHELSSGQDFHDHKLYQHMLQDFLALSVAPNREDTRNVVKRTSMNKSKQQVDRRASKGRKVRFMVVPKLVNFTFPVARLQSHKSGMDEEEWFKSLFGGTAKYPSK